MSTGWVSEPSLLVDGGKRRREGEAGQANSALGHGHELGQTERERQREWRAGSPVLLGQAEAKESFFFFSFF
jgi:hypothetical protein